MNQFSTASDRTAFPANILCIDQFASLGGGQRSLLDLLPAFSKRGWRPSVAVPGEGPLPEMVRSLGYRTHSFACGSYASRKKPLTQLLKYAFELPGMVKSLAELVKANEIDLLYVNGPRLVPSAAWVAWRRAVPLVFHCHNRLVQYSAVTLTGQALELASAHVIACCKYAADPLREYVAPQRLRILYNGIAERGPGRLESAQRIRRIGVVGRVEEEKGQLQFVQAARLIYQKAPECRFSVIGTPMFSGVEYYRKVIASSSGLPIDFIDWQNDVAEIYSGLDLLVVPSSNVEATTRVILEAYSAGIPVVAFPAGGIPEILEDEETGFLAEAMTVEALAQRILSVLQMDKARRTAVVKSAREEWQHRFTLGAYRDSVCRVLAEAMQPIFQGSYDELRATAGVARD
ncbi:MAG TPA: glycosyltransferase family 4 protein [Bryobacteraceae bacterium]|nr:glycosyltransferase family 4 protein [Bryobacteraceae bacterium]